MAVHDRDELRRGIGGGPVAVQLDTVPLEAGDPDDEFSLFTTIAIEDPFPYSDELHLDFLRLFGDEDVHAVFAAMTPVFRAPILLTIDPWVQLQGSGRHPWGPPRHDPVAAPPRPEAA